MDPDRSGYFAWGPETPLSQCAYCKHLDRDAPVAVCAAFPGSIPDAFLRNEADHRQPWMDPATGRPGDRGVPDDRSITFEPRDGVNPVALTALYRILDALA